MSSMTPSRAAEEASMTRVVCIPTARPTFVVAAAEERAGAARALLAELGAEVAGPTGLVMTPGDVEAAAAYLDTDADLVVNVCASFSDATPALRLYRDLGRPVLLWSFREPGPVGDRLWLNSLCGANLFGHALVREGVEVRLLYGDPDEPEVRATLQRALTGDLPPAPKLPTAQRQRSEDSAAVRTALATLRGRRIGIVGDAPPGFTPSEYDADLVARLFGVTVEQLTLDEMFAKVRDVDLETQTAELADARQQRPTLSSLDETHVQLFAAVTSALRGWSADQLLSAIAVRCWPEFPTRLGVCPCSSLSRIADEGTPTACERDVYGALTMLLLETLGSGPTYLVDTVDLQAADNIVRVWHCGSAATKVAADPANATQYVHCNRKIGVAGDFPLKTGRVVLSRLTEDPQNPGGLRLLIGVGDSVPAPNRFQGNTADVLLDTPADEFVHGLVTGGFPHHTVLAWRDVRPMLRTAADLLGIPVVEW
jgi:L-fucose isomerase-like protein